MYCSRHPRVETFLRCGKCDKPICPDCTVFGPAGARCRDCAELRSNPLYKVPASRLGFGIAAGLAAGVVAGFFCAVAAAAGMFVQVWVAILTGSAAGEAVLRAVQRKRGRWVEAAACCAVALGAACGLLLRTFQTTVVADVVDAAIAASSDLGSLVAIGLITLCAWSRTRL